MITGCFATLGLHACLIRTVTNAPCSGCDVGSAGIRNRLYMAACAALRRDTGPSSSPSCKSFNNYKFIIVFDKASWADIDTDTVMDDRTAAFDCVHVCERACVSR